MTRTTPNNERTSRKTAPERLPATQPAKARSDAMRPDPGRPPAPAAANPISSNIDPSPFSQQRRQQAARERFHAIAEAAYYIAQRRGFQPGQELQDWLSAEREIDARRY
jgi:hypothetical protein